MGKEKPSSITELKDKRAKFENEVNEFQKEVSERTYEIELENTSNLKAILKQIDKSYEWNIKNAALVINLYESLKLQNVTNVSSNSGKTSVALNSLDLNTLYSVLTSINGTGVESAKTFVKLLTNVGLQITEAMNKLADDNKEIQQKHVELAEMDVLIDGMEKEQSEPISADEVTI